MSNRFRRQRGGTHGIGKGGLIMSDARNPILVATSTCIGCGCSDTNACWDEQSNNPCHWVRLDHAAGLGVCSACPESVARWDAGDRTVAVPVNAEPGGLAIWTVYNNLKDFPGQYVALKWINDTPTQDLLAAGSLDSLRDLLPPGLVCMTRNTGDDPTIVETWF